MKKTYYYTLIASILGLGTLTAQMPLPVKIVGALATLTFGTLALLQATGKLK